MEKKSGIYKLTYKNSNKFYIGSTTNFNKRKQQHKRNLERNIHCNKILQSIFNKYGMFEFEIIEYCEPLNLVDREQYHLDKQSPQLNILKIAFSSLGYKHTEEIKSKLKTINKEIVNRPEVYDKISKTFFKKGESTVMSNLTKEKLRQAKLGKKASEESKNKMRQTKLGKKASEETKIKMSKYRKITPQKNWIKICKLDLNDNIIEIYPNITSACESLNVKCSRYIKNTLDNKRETYKGFKWKYYGE